MTAPSAPTPARSNLQLRIISAVALGVVTLALTWLGGAWFRFFGAAVAALMFHEWSMMSGTGKRPALLAACWLAMAAACAALLVGLDAGTVFSLIALGTFAALVIGSVIGAGFSAALGLAYAGSSGAALAFLRGDDAAGLSLILFLFVVVWATDIAAYFVGRSVGGPKLAPSISPGKTWSGAAGGLGIAMILGVAVVGWMGGPLVAAAIAATVLSIVSQAGDLAESAAKRRYGVKDSSNLIPGHGGVLDRVDGLVAAAMALYVLVLLAPSLARP